MAISSYNKLVYRNKVKRKIIEKELIGGEAFFEDVEADEKGRVLSPDDVDYLKEKKTSKIKAFFAEMLANILMNKVKKENKVEIVGLENLKDVKSGYIITGNHFHFFESANAMLINKKINPHKKLYRVIKESNYSMKGLFGFLMRNSYSLPLSSNMKTMMKFNKSVSMILNNGDNILIYPEQAMWWNYRKPRPHKEGAAFFAIKNNVPLVSYFVTMEDLDKEDEYGDPIQKYIVHIFPPIYPSKDKSFKENEEDMTRLNYKNWVKCYEEFYKEKLEYGQKENSLGSN